MITAARVTELHAAGSSIGPLGGYAQKPGCVDGAIGAAMNGAIYHRQDSDDPDPLLVAAYLLRSLVADHCFTDGNKRAAWLATLEVLAVGATLTIRADQEEAADFVLRVAGREIESTQEIARWLAARLVSLQVC